MCINCPTRAFSPALGTPQRVAVPTASHAASMQHLRAFGRAHGIRPDGDVDEVVLRDHGFTSAKEYRERVRSGACSHMVGWRIIQHAA